jgi:hypothetical protein
VRSTDETFQKKEKENSHTGAVVKSQATIGVFKSSMMCVETWNLYVLMAPKRFLSFGCYAATFRKARGGA